jgi:hypothetical protein
MQMQMQNSILICGIEGALSFTICKELIDNNLIDTIFVFNSDCIVTKENVESSYFYSESDINKKYVSIFIDRIKEYNKDINIMTVEHFYHNQKVTLLINLPIKIVNDIYKPINSRIVILYSKGLSGVLFVDINTLSDSITVSDDRIFEPVQIGSISNDGYVQCAPHNYHNYKTGDTIKFTNLEIEGSNEQLNKEFTITVNNNLTFQLDNYNNNDSVFINGTTIYVHKENLIENYKSFQDQLLNPTIGNRSILDTYIKSYTEDDKSFSMLAQTFKYEIINVVTIMSAMTTFEIMKLLLKQYVPLKQWRVYVDETLLSYYNPNNENTKTLYGKLFASKLEDKLLNSEYILVGKNETLYNILSKMNVKKIHDAYVYKEKETNLFENVNINNITGVICGFNKYNNKRFIDSQCFEHNKPYFVSSVENCSGDTYVSIPFLTKTYSDQVDPSIDYKNDKSYPLCVLTSFPNNINHTIQWSLDKFELFKNAPLYMNKYLDDKTFIDKLSDLDTEKTKALSYIKLFDNSFVNIAIELFTKEYDTEIIKLLETHKPDLKNENGTLFWSGGKRCPKPIKFDKDNELHLDYVTTTCNILETMENKYSEIIFDKKNELHVKWITLSSNLRAMNYNIPIKSYNEINKKDFKINILKNLTSGLLSMEILKHLLESTNYTNYSFNLSNNTIIGIEPEKAPMIKVGSTELNSWTKFTYTKDTTLQVFKEHYESMFQTVLTMIVIDTSMIYAEFMDSTHINLDKNLSDIIDSNVENTVFTLASEDDDLELPYITVKL